MRLLIFVILTSSAVISATKIPDHHSPADSSFWPNFITAAAPPQLQSLGTAQSFAALSPHSPGYLSLGGSAAQLYPRKHKEQQEAMTQSTLVSTYPAPYLYLHRPSQQQQGNYISYTQLVPSFQALSLEDTPFQKSYQQRYNILPYNYTQGLNVSASQSVPATGFFPLGHNSYYPSAVGLSPSWPALTLSALQPSSGNGVGGFSATPLYQSATSTDSLNSLPPVTFDSLYKNQKVLNADYLTFPVTVYNQDYGQLGLSEVKQNPNGQVRLGKQRVNMAAPAGEHKTTAREPPAKGRYQYSSKYSKPLPDSEDKESYTRSSPQELDDSYDSEENPKSSDSSRYSNNENDDKDDGDYRSSYNLAENTKRPHYTPPSNNDDDSVESSEFPSRSCSFFKSSPSKEASSHSETFSDVRHDFEDQFKAFPTSENFKVPDFTAESSKAVADYYKNPVSSSEKRLKMVFSQHSKLTDNYMSPTEQRSSESPKTLHYYNYKPPEYSYDKPVEYFKRTSFKSSSEESTAHPESPASSDDREADDHDSSATVTRRNKMYTHAE